MTQIHLRFLALLLSMVGAQAELFVSSHNNSQVFRFNETNFVFIDIFIPNTNGRLQAPHGLAFGPDGNLYVASAGNDRVLRYNGQTGAYIDDYIASGVGELDYPVALIFRGTNLFVSSQLNDRVLRFNATTGAFIENFVTNSPALDGPSDMVFGRDGNLYVVGRFNNRVVRYDGKTGALIDTFVNSNLSQPFGARFLPTGVLLVASGNENVVRAFNSEGTYFRDQTTGNLSFPIGFVLGIDELIVTSFNNSQIARFNIHTRTFISTFTAPGLNGPNFMIFRPSPRPTLSIRRVGADGVELSWPESPTPLFNLSDSGEPTFEANYPFPYQTDPDGTNRIVREIIFSPDEPRFFRLEKPF